MTQSWFTVSSIFHTHRKQNYRTTRGSAHCYPCFDFMGWSSFTLFSSLGKNSNARAIYTEIWRSVASSKLPTYDLGGCCYKENVSWSYVDTVESDWSQYESRWVFGMKNLTSRKFWCIFFGIFGFSDRDVARIFSGEGATMVRALMDMPLHSVEQIWSIQDVKTQD